MHNKYSQLHYQAPSIYGHFSGAKVSYLQMFSWDTIWDIDFIISVTGETKYIFMKSVGNMQISVWHVLPLVQTKLVNTSREE